MRKITQNLRGFFVSIVIFAHINTMLRQTKRQAVPCCCAQSEQSCTLVGKIVKCSNIFNRERKEVRKDIWCMLCQKIMTLAGVFYGLKGSFLTRSRAAGHRNPPWSNHLLCERTFYHPTNFDNMPWHCHIYVVKQDFTSRILTAPQRISLMYDLQFIGVFCENFWVWIFLFVCLLVFLRKCVIMLKYYWSTLFPKGSVMILGLSNNKNLQDWLSQYDWVDKTWRKAMNLHI